METFLIIIAIGAICIGCFCVGAKVGQAGAKGETFEIPTVNPLGAYRKHEAKKVAEMEQDKFDTIMRNIECYDGTGKGQEDIKG